MAACFKTKAFGWVVVWSLIENIKNSKNNKKCQTCRSLTKFLQKLFPKLIMKNPFLPFVRLNAQIRLSAHLKLDTWTKLSAWSVIYGNLIKPSTKLYKKKLWWLWQNTTPTVTPVSCNSLLPTNTKPTTSTRSYLFIIFNCLWNHNFTSFLRIN